MKLRAGEINLYVADLDKAARFYQAALDFEQVERGESFRRMAHGDVVLTLFRARTRGPAAAPGVEPCMTADLHVDDIEEAARRLALHGARVSAIREYPGGRHLLWRDPDGISWELLCP